MPGTISELMPDEISSVTALALQPDEPIVLAENLVAGYGEKNIIQQLSLAIRRGEWLSLIGANGCGKSTLLKLLSRVITGSSGIIFLDGKAIHHQPNRAIAQILASLPQQPSVPVGLTVEQLVGMGRSPHQDWWQWELSALDREFVDEAIEITQMADHRKRLVETLSGGERQRAFLALALAQKPQIIFLDEPTTYLDIHYQLELLDLLAQLNRDQHLTIVTVLHEINLALRYSHQIALMKEGQILAIGPPLIAVTPANLRATFNIEAAIIETPIGQQICPLYSINKN
jgi:iron complex transport system ATP-binding protein